MNIIFSGDKIAQKSTVAIFATEGGKLSAQGNAIDKLAAGRISKTIKATGFVGKKEQSLDIADCGAFNRVIVFGLGKPDGFSRLDWELAGGALAALLMGLKVGRVHVGVGTTGSTSMSEADIAALLASGASLRDYRFDVYKTKKADNGTKLGEIMLHLGNPAAARKAFVAHDAIRQGNHLARDLVNEPANVLFPIEFAKRAAALAKAGVRIEVLNAAQMKKLGMAALLGVAQGSPHEPRLVVMRWNGGRKGEAPISFVGKGVTFDTGGVSIKPAAGMEDMKGDMAGAACVTGLMLTLARRKAKVNVVGAIGLVENAVDGKAQRPGDVVKSMSGQTIAVLNTDAEGRLVLADVLWYVQQRFKPKFMINLATLTGAILVALGKEHAGLFSNNDELATRIASSGYTTGEKVWRLPLTPEYDKIIDHDVADVKNTGGRFAGSITAAQFLQRFVNKVPWAHLDIAGTAMDSVKTPINQSWASGWGVRLLNDLIASHYETR